MKNRFFSGFGVCAAVVALSATGAATAEAAPCTPVSTSQGAMTAQLVNPANVTSTVNASGCDIGVYYNVGATGAINAADISGANKYGVFNDGGAVTVSNSDIHEIGNVPFDGVQIGVAVRYSNGATGSVTNSDIYRYQKNGFVISGQGTNVDVVGNSVTGNGPVAYIAQNGVQYSFGATGTVDSNDISDHYYTGCSNKDAAKTGCVAYVAAGLLFYDVNPSEVKGNQNKFRNNQRNQIMYPSAAVSAGS
ncbi:MAG: hypothetical protein QOI31_2975 [Solirubrobacterales bacterium]|jgi:hypothetical protein|nr:hypothetical protein [Solirubrobacterales bacterium]